MIRVEKKAVARGKTFVANIEIYSNTAEMINDLRIRKRTDKRFDDMPQKELDVSWHGVSKYEDALKLLHDGYQPVVDQIRQELYIKPAASINGSQKRYYFENDVAGFQPVVPMAILGLPNSMINMHIRPIRSKIVDIYYDMSCSWLTSSQTIIRNGILVLKYINHLEQQGYKVNLYSVQFHCDDDSGDALCVKVKDSNRPLDLKRISVPIAHTSFFRVLGFDWYSKFPAGKFRRAYGHALAYNFEEEDLQSVIHQLLGPNAVYISAECILDGGEKYIKRALQIK